MRRPCRYCGERVPLPKPGNSRARVTCDRPDCLAAARGDARRSYVTRLRTRTTKRCPACFEEKPLDEKHWYVAARKPDGSVEHFDGYCRPCKRADQRERYKTSAVRRADARARASVQRAAIAERRVADSGFDAEYRAYCNAQRREWRERWRKRGRTEPLRIVPAGGLVPARPLGALMEQEVERVRTQMAKVGNADVCESAVCDFYKRVGVNERTVFRWNSVARPRARFDVADRLLSRLEVLWWDVYDPERFPDLYAPQDWPDVVDAASRAWTGESLLAAA